MNDPAGCTALVLYSGDGSSAEAQSDVSGAGADVAVAAAADVLQPESKPEPEPEPRRFVGLSNQGATCYMNSLLQTLYMTPEVRFAFGRGGRAC